MFAVPTSHEAAETHTWLARTTHDACRSGERVDASWRKKVEERVGLVLVVGYSPDVSMLIIINTVCVAVIGWLCMSWRSWGCICN